MIIKAAEIITKFFIRIGILKEKDRDICQRNIETVIFSCINLVLVLIIGILFRKVELSFLYYIMWMTICRYTGECDIGSYLQRSKYFVVTFLCTHLIQQALLIRSKDVVLLFMLQTCTLVFVKLYAPVLNNRKNLTNRLIELEKKKAILAVGMWCILSLILWIKERDISYYIQAVLLMIMALMVIGKIKGKAVENKR